MTPQDQEMIRQSPVLQADPAPAIILSRDASLAGEAMNRFCDQIRSLVPTLKIQLDNEPVFPAPILVIGRHRNIGYQAAPSGKFLSCFLEALDQACMQHPAIDPELDSRLKQIDLPVLLKLYVSTHCPHCPQSIHRLQTLAAASRSIRLQIIDAGAFTDAARQDQIHSVPTLILDDHIRWTGAVNIEELLTQCTQRDPSQLSAASLRQLIEAGDAARIATMMTQCGRIFPALTDLLIHERWPLRLGAMVTAEYLAEADPALSLQLCEALWQRFERISSPVQVDVVQVLGQTDAAPTRSYLQSVSSGDYDPEVKTAATEVLEEMGADTGQMQK
jgi:hypothetical protein